MSTSLVHSFHPLTLERTLSARTIVQACLLGYGLESGATFINIEELFLSTSIKHSVKESLIIGDNYSKREINLYFIYLVNVFFNLHYAAICRMLIYSSLQ